MKNLIALFCFASFIGTNHSVFAQESSDDVIDDLPQNFMDRSPIYDYTELQLNNTDSIADFADKENKLKISGTIYKSDGVTPAKDVILFIEQPDEYGNFDLRKENDKRYVHHRGWIKTDADGRYTFYTFVPGNDRQYNQLQEIFPMIKESSKPEYEIESFLFDEDPLLSKRCRRQISKKSDTTRILKLKSENGMFVTTRDIVLEQDVTLVSK